MSAIHILVFNHNGGELLKECLPSVLEAAQHSPLACRVSVVDNASSDGSRGWLKSAQLEADWQPCDAGSRASCINGVVQGLKEDLVLFLTFDMKVEPGFITPLVDALRARPEAFGAGSRQLNAGGAYAGGMNRCGRQGSVAWAGPRYPGSDSESRRPGDTLFSRHLLLRRDKFLSLGGFAGHYGPAGWEDADLGARAWTQGWPTLYVPGSVIGQRSPGTAFRVRRTADLRDATRWFLRNAPLRELGQALLWLPWTIMVSLVSRWSLLGALVSGVWAWPSALWHRQEGDRAWWTRLSGRARVSE